MKEQQYFPVQTSNLGLQSRGGSITDKCNWLAMADSLLRGQQNFRRHHNITEVGQDIYLAFSILTITTNISSAIAIVILNSLLLRFHIHNKKSPSRILVCNLAVTDILTGLVVQPAYIVHIIVDLMGGVSFTALFVFNFAAYLVCGMSLVTAGGMSLDRLLATIKPFSYKIYGKPKIFTAVVIFIWVQGVCFVSLYTVNVINNALAQLAFILTVAFAVISFVVSYTIIMRSIRRRERRITHTGPYGPDGTRNQPLAKNKKITKTFASMIIALCLMYLPMFVVKILLWKAGPSQLVALNIANRVANTITFLNSLLNALLYCYNNIAVRREIQSTLSKYCLPFRNSSIQPMVGKNRVRSRVVSVSSFS